MGAVGKNSSDSVVVHDEQQLRYALSKSEDQIRYDDTETAVVYDQDGNLLLNKNQGIVDEVSFTAAEAQLFSDAIFTHNHPSGNTFSAADIQTAVYTGIKEMRACYYIYSNGEFSSGAYVLTRDYDIGDKIPSSYLNFAQDYQNAMDGYKTDTVDPVWNNSSQTNADAKKCNTMISDFRKQWLHDNSSKYGWVYKEEKK